MKVALIPPIPELGFFGHSDFHLCLAHLTNRKKYVEHYLQESQNGAYIVMDNSAHEFKVGSSEKQLLKAFKAVQANELAVPDVLWDGQATLAKTSSALDYFSQDETFRELHPRIMLIPQGKDRKDWDTCLVGQMLKVTRMQRLYPDVFDRPPVIGLSKDYEVWEGGLLDLVRSKLNPLHFGYGVDVHLLGWGRKLWKVPNVVAEYPWIRSIDSAKPFVFALKEIELEAYKTEPEYPTRPKEYFDISFNQEQRRIAFENVAVFKGSMINASRHST